MSSLSDSEYVKMKAYFTVEHDVDEMLRYDVRKGGPSKFRYGMMAGFNKSYEKEHGMEVLAKCAEAYERFAQEPHVDPGKLEVLRMNISRIAANLAKNQIKDEDAKMQEIFAKLNGAEAQREKKVNATHNAKAMECPLGIDPKVYQQHQKEFFHRLLHPQYDRVVSEEELEDCFQRLIQGKERLPGEVEEIQEKLKKMVIQEERKELNLESLLREGIDSKAAYHARLNPAVKFPPSYEDIISGRVGLGGFQAQIGLRLFYEPCEQEIDEFLRNLEELGFSLEPEKVDQVKQRILREGKASLEFSKKISADNLSFLEAHSVVSRKDFESKIENPKATCLYDDFILGEKEIKDWEKVNGHLFKKSSSSSSQSSAKVPLLNEERNFFSWHGWNPSFSLEEQEILGIKNNPSPNPYEILGVDHNASKNEIDKIYKRFALKLHPDKNPGKEVFAEKLFKAVGEARQLIIAKKQEDRKVGW